MSIDVKLYQASQHCERAARRARELLYQPGGPVASELEAVRNCILLIEQVRELNPTDNPGFHEAALRRIVAAYPEEDTP